MSNPCHLVTKNRERRRKRFLTDEDLRRLGRVLDEAETRNEISVRAVAAIPRVDHIPDSHDEIVRFLRIRTYSFATGLTQSRDKPRASKRSARPVAALIPERRTVTARFRHFDFPCLPRACREPSNLAATWL